MGRGVYKSRVKNSRRNIISGLVKQFISIGLQFAIRTVIIYSLGAEYQGLNGLFTSILSILNLSDMGFSAAVTYILYKPIAVKNQEQINSVLAYLKHIYVVVGTVILVFGIIIMPFLPRLISGTYPSNINIYILFSIYLANAVVSYYLFAYKNALLTAYQREDIVSNAYSITLILSRGLQFFLLLVFHNYYVYAVVLPIGSVINNLLVQFFSKKYFPDSLSVGSIDKDLKGVLNRQVRAVFVNRLSDVARNSFDNVVLSVYFGLIAVTVYDNYYYIYSAVIGIMGIIVHGVKASIGNSIVVESVEKNREDLTTFTFVFMWIAGWCTTCLFCLYQPFMKLWMHSNQELLLPFADMVLFCIYFYAMCMAYSKNAYLEAKGLFKECQIWYVSEAIVNLILNILFGRFFGVTGILIATIINIIGLNFCGGTRVLYKYYFLKGRLEYYKSHIIYLMVTIITAITTYFFCSKIATESVIGLVIKMAICVIVPNLIYLMFYFKTKQFNNAKVIVRTVFGK